MVTGCQQTINTTRKVTTILISNYLQVTRHWQHKKKKTIKKLRHLFFPGKPNSLFKCYVQLPCRRRLLAT